MNIQTPLGWSGKVGTHAPRPLAELGVEPRAKNSKRVLTASLSECSSEFPTHGVRPSWTGSSPKLSCAVLTMAIMLSTSVGRGKEKSPAESVIRVHSTAVTGLYGEKSLRMEGSVAPLDQRNMVMRWVGQGSITWQVKAPKSGDYEVALCYASLSDGSQFEVVSGNSTITGKVHKTVGMFMDRRTSQTLPIYRSYLENYERVRLDGTLHLIAGMSEITIRVTEATSGEVMQFHSLELTPVAAKESIAADEERARKRRAGTDWFVKAGYGVMFHWDASSQPRLGPQKSYAEAVREFDVEAFTNMVEDTGAGYVLFRLNGRDPHCPAPIAAWEKIHPGWTTQRDLIADLADALGKRGIKLTAYIASNVLGKLNLVSQKELVDIHEKILTEIGLRYGKKLAGYWFDGWDWIAPQHPNIPYERLFEAGKAGNPDRIISFNFWFFPELTPWQEYWAGEITSIQKPVTGRYIEYAAGEGLQSHTMLMLEDNWGHRTPNTEMELPRFTEEHLIRYVKACMGKQGVVTINLGIYQDGTIGKESFKMMQALRRAIRK